MGVRELSKWLQRGPQVIVATVTQEEEERASRLYAKYLDHLQSIASYVPIDPPTAEETAFLVDVIARMARQGKQFSLPIQSETRSEVVSDEAAA